MEQALDHYFDESWKLFVADSRKKADISNRRMFRLLATIKGDEFVRQLRLYMVTLKAKHATLRVVRKPIGVAVADRRFGLIPQVWVKQGQDELGKYAYVCIQIKAQRWLMFVA